MVERLDENKVETGMSGDHAIGGFSVSPFPRFPVSGF
jgi:hypothetical protein